MKGERDNAFAILADSMSIAENAAPKEVNQLKSRLEQLEMDAGETEEAKNFLNQKVRTSPHSFTLHLSLRDALSLGIHCAHRGAARALEERVGQWRARAGTQNRHSGPLLPSVMSKTLSC